jgi:hypothetical protein
MGRGKRRSGQITAPPRATAGRAPLEVTPTGVIYSEANPDRASVDVIFRTTDLPAVDIDWLFELAATEGLTPTARGILNEWYTTIAFEAPGAEVERLPAAGARLCAALSERLGVTDTGVRVWGVTPPAEEMNAFLDADKSDRVARWAQTESLLKNLAGGTGTTVIEPAVEGLVTACLALGVSTFASCEGHDPLQPGFAEHSNATVPYLAVGRRYEPELKEESTQEAEERQARSLEDAFILAALVDEFYRERERNSSYGIYLDEQLGTAEGLERAKAGVAVRAEPPFWWGGKIVQTLEHFEDGTPYEMLNVVYGDERDQEQPELTTEEYEAFEQERAAEESRLLPARQQEFVEFGVFLKDIFFDGIPAACPADSALRTLLEPRLG